MSSWSLPLLCGGGEDNGVGFIVGGIRSDHSTRWRVWWGMQMTTEPDKKSVTLSYGTLALILLGTLLLGLLSGAIFGSQFRRAAPGRPPLTSGQVPSANRAWIGISYIPLTMAVAQSKNLPVNSGALIVAVTPNSPAERAGLHESDIVTMVDQVAIGETTSMMDLIMSKNPGDHIVISILRDNNEQSLDVVLGRAPGGIRQQDTKLWDRLWQR